MLETIGEFIVESSGAAFASLNQSKQRYTENFILQDKIGVCFDRKDGGMIEISATDTNGSPPSYRIKPINMGASEWYSLEYDILLDSFADTDLIVAILDTASAKTVSTFAILRIFYEDGRSEDVSSRQMEIRHRRKKQAFAINISDILSSLTENIKFTQIIFFIEARNVAIDIFGLSVASAVARNENHKMDDIKRIHSAQNVEFPSRFKCVLDAKLRGIWTGTTTKHRALTKNVFIDLEPGSGRQASVTRRDNHLIVDFSKATDGRWRTIEFRFDNVNNTGTVFALLHFQWKCLCASPIEATLVLREYGDDSEWNDVHIPFSINMDGESQVRQYFIDLSSLLNSEQNCQRFGVFLFFPPAVDLVAIKELEVSVFDLPLTRD